MKKNLLFLCMLTTIRLFGAMPVTTTTIAGHWIIANSPYLVYNDILVDSFSTLTIDPGVSVIFQGPYSLEVQGILKATGTLDSPILFTINDTTGWATDNTTSMGGWHGIHLRCYGGSGTDSSTLNHCNIYYTKIDSTFGTGANNTLEIERNFAVFNCNFKYAKVNPNCMDANITIHLGVALEFGFNTVSNSFSGASNISLSGYYSPSSIYFHDNKIYQNQSAFANVNCAYVNMLFENNELYDNIANGTSSQVSTLAVDGDIVTIRKNIFHDNTCFSTGAINCISGTIDIVDNLICNNQQYGTGCGGLEGGGGIMVCSNGTMGPDSTFYKIRNNIIANNHCALSGGGIYVYQARANISNNDIVHNSSLGSGDGIEVALDSQSLVIINNLFFGNNALPNVDGVGNGNIEYDHNWSEFPYYQDVTLYSVYTVAGDTLTNVIGTDPGMVSPTSTVSVTESALSSDFSLLNTSGCINMGDSTGAFADSLDYAGNPRIIGTIDIGAYELRHSILGVTSKNHPESSSLEVFPNPATNIIIVMVSEIGGELVLTDISGKILNELNVNQKQNSFDIHSLPAGVYFVNHIIGGNVRSVQKVLVE